MSNTTFVIISAIAGLVAGLIIGLFLKSRGLGLLKNIVFGLAVGVLGAVIGLLGEMILLG